MVRAFTTVDAATGMAEDVCDSIREEECTRDAHVVAGDFDVMIELEGETPHEILRTVTERVRALEGAGTTRTYLCLD